MWFDAAVLTVGGLADFGLETPCVCGGRWFRAPRLLRYRTCWVVRCSACGLLRTSPEPGAEALREIYDARTSAKYTLDRGDVHEAQWTGFAGGLMDLVEGHRAPPGRLLDIGCDTGTLLVHARERGWTVQGVEVNEPLARQVSAERQVPVAAGTLEQAGFADASFDVVVFNQVLEHVTDPSAFLREVVRILAPGGVVCVGVPCFSSPIPVLLKRERWYALLPSEHVWQFGPRTLPRLLREAGLDVLQTRRGCSAYWGPWSWRPRAMARWCLYRTVRALGQGDFIEIVASPAVAHRACEPVSR
jgi:SAM-dependent methyltransferase